MNDMDKTDSFVFRLKKEWGPTSPWTDNAIVTDFTPSEDHPIRLDFSQCSLGKTSMVNNPEKYNFGNMKVCYQCRLTNNRMALRKKTKSAVGPEGVFQAGTVRPWPLGSSAGSPMGPSPERRR